MQTIKNKAFCVSIQWNALVRRLLSLEKGRSHKSEIMLDKVTKACYNLLALFYAIFNKEMLLLFLVKLLKGFYQSHS